MTTLAMNPFPYQIEDFKFLVNKKKAGLTHPPGVGKTFGTMLAITYLLENNPSYKAVVVVPSILINSWYEKFAAYFNSDLTILRYAGTVRQREMFNLSKYRIIIVSFGILQRDYKITFAKLKPEILTVDETKYIKNGEVKLSKKSGNMNKFGIVQALSSRAQYTFLLNGTPLSKSPADLFHFIQLFNPNIYVTRKNFMRVHAKYMVGNDGYPMLIGWKKLEQISTLLNHYTRRVLKEDVLDLPGKTLIIRQFDLDFKHKERVKELWEFGFLEIQEHNSEEDIFLEGMALAMRVRQATIDPRLVGLSVKSAYVENLENLLDDLGDEQVIIFAHFQNTISILRSMLQRRKSTFAEIHGRVTSKNKDKAVNDYKERKVQYLLANPKSAGVGLDFQQSRNVVYFELDHEVDSFWQGIDRVHRPGQDREVSIFVLIAANTIAVTLLRGIKENVNFVAKVLQGKEESSIFWNSKITVEEQEKWKKL